MKTVFVVLGILLILLFLAWLFLVRPGKDRKWMVLIFDVALIMVSALVLTMGFMMRSRYNADNPKAGDAAEEEGTPKRLQEGDAMEGDEIPQESGASQGTGRTEGNGGTQGSEGTQNPQEGQNPEGAQETPAAGGTEGTGGTLGTGGTEVTGGTPITGGTEGTVDLDEAQGDSSGESQSGQDSRESDQGEEDSRESGQEDQNPSGPDGEEESSESEYIE